MTVEEMRERMTNREFWRWSRYWSVRHAKERLAAKKGQK